MTRPDILNNGFNCHQAAVDKCRQKQDANLPVFLLLLIYLRAATTQSLIHLPESACLYYRPFTTSIVPDIV